MKKIIIVGAPSEALVSRLYELGHSVQFVDNIEDVNVKLNDFSYDSSKDFSKKVESLERINPAGLSFRASNRAQRRAKEKGYKLRGYTQPHRIQNNNYRKSKFR